MNSYSSDPSNIWFIVLYQHGFHVTVESHSQFLSQIIQNQNKFNSKVKKSRAPRSTKQERMHIHKHTVDLTKKKEQNVLVPLPALYACWSRTRCTLCSSVCAGRQRFLRTSRRGNCWCSTWNIRTYQIILSSTKGATEGETCTMTAIYYFYFLIKISPSCERTIKFLPIYSVPQLNLGNFWCKTKIFSTVSLARTFNLWFWRAAEVSLSPNHFFTKQDRKESHSLCKNVLITSTEAFIQGPECLIFKLLLHPHWTPQKMQNLTAQLVRKENVINITPLLIWKQLNTLLH